MISHTIKEIFISMEQKSDLPKILMAEEALHLWFQGKDAWNNWVEENPETLISFQGFEFSLSVIKSTLANRIASNEIDDLDNLSSLINFSGFKFKNVVFDESTFRGKVSFASAVFEGEASFDKASFKEGVIFSRTTFNSIASFLNTYFYETTEFSHVSFSSDVKFKYALFYGPLAFNDSDILGSAKFENVQFNHTVDFKNTNFRFTAYFDNSNFELKTFFSKAKINNQASFKGSTFKAQSYFLGTIFKGNTCFSEAEFKHDVSFDRSSFFGSMANFTKSRFHSNFSFQPNEVKSLKKVSFEGASFDKQLTISGHYNCIPDLRQTKTSHHIDLSLLTIKLNRHFLKNTGMEAAIEKEDADRLCRLKEIAESNKNHERALAFHADELRAKRWHVFSPWQSILDGLYSLTSNYGQSIMRPSMYLLASVFIFASATLSQTKQSSYDIAQMKAALTISVATATPFLAISKEARTKSTEELFNKELPDNYYLYSYIHSGSSFVFMFLIGLGLRNRFRI